MLLPYGSPITFATTGITVSGATALTSLAGLKDGRPGAITRLQWPSGAQTTSTAITIDTTWATPIVPRVAGLVNVRGLPAGLRVRIGWQQTEGGAFDYQQQDSILFDNQAGDRFAWDTWASGLNACYGVRIEVFNDDGDSGTPVTVEAQFDIGEVYAAPAVDLSPIGESESEFIAGETVLALSGQPYFSESPVRNRVPLQFLPVDAPEYPSVRGALWSLAISPALLVSPDGSAEFLMYGRAADIRSRRFLNGKHAISMSVEVLR